MRHKVVLRHVDRSIRSIDGLPDCGDPPTFHGGDGGTIGASPARFGQTRPLLGRRSGNPELVSDALSMRLWGESVVSPLGWAADISRSIADRIHTFVGFLAVERLSKSGHLRGGSFPVRENRWPG